MIINAANFAKAKSSSVSSKFRRYCFRRVKYAKKYNPFSVVNAKTATTTNTTPISKKPHSLLVNRSEISFAFVKLSYPVEKKSIEYPHHLYCCHLKSPFIYDYININLTQNE